MIKSIASICLALACLASTTPAVSAIHSASFGASLTLLDSCRVDSGSAAPVVRCQMASQAMVTAAPAPLAAEAPAWLVSF